MSHSRQRKDKICLNCNSQLHGGFCHICGQENVEPKETVIGLIAHFFYDITHFDGKFFSTVKYLLVRPGYLSKEYIKGRRARYLHPIRMYVFTSAFFFIIFFSIFNLDKFKKDNSDILRGTPSKQELQELKAVVLKEAKSPQDSLRMAGVINRLEKLPVKIVIDTNTSSKTSNVRTRINLPLLKYDTKAAYDSAQASLPIQERDGWYEKAKNYKLIEASNKMNGDINAFIKDFLDKLFHKLPQLLFVSLPFFALILKLLYYRRKNYYYTDHAIFSIHLYIFTFTILFFLIMLNQLNAKFHWNWLGYLTGALIIYFLFYCYKAMKNFYQQGWLKTFIKFCLLNIMSGFLIFFLFIMFFILSIFEI